MYEHVYTRVGMNVIIDIGIYVYQALARPPLNLIATWESTQAGRFSLVSHPQTACLRKQQTFHVPLRIHVMCLLKCGCHEHDTCKIGVHISVVDRCLTWPCYTACSNIILHHKGEKLQIMCQKLKDPAKQQTQSIK